ncbi:hypothetical protein ACIA8G_03550 [Lentzea sp. NPDC051213]|uniref:hypothetical protein n=1 Tax=Lentzea sp. NPDC051213 TaxID=3364126 RepID=UPI0037B76BE2
MGEWARPAVRLHPVSGAPGVMDSHLGGPLLWPADEEWPHCDGSKHDEGLTILATDSVGVRVALTSAAQLYARDFPELPFPDGTDLLQVLLCPLEHTDEETDHFGPCVRLVWRSSAGVTDVFGTPPEPAVFEPQYRTRPCVLHPCRIVEYPMGDEQPVGAGDWPPVANGSKIGGWAFWWQTSPYGLECPECGTDRRLLLALYTHEEPEKELCSCEVAERAVVGWEFGREGALNVFACTEDVRHPIKLHVD